MHLLTVLIIPVLSACFAHYIAYLKNRREWLWAILALLFNFVALLVLCCMPEKKIDNNTVFFNNYIDDKEPINSE